LLLALPLTGCLRPLHGPTASGENLAEVLGAIKVEPIKIGGGLEYFGHTLQSETIFQLDGSGQPRPKRYKLSLAIAQLLQTPTVDSRTGRADSATLTVNTAYTLESLEGGPPITKGVVISYATYDRSIQRFANVRAARDAQERVARETAVQLRTRLASFLATRL
jgi:LPS-assembly lipoprotein